MNDQTPLPPGGSRGKRIKQSDRIMTRLITGAHRLLLRATAGHLLNTMGGNPVRILTTIGHQTGRPRRHPVITIEDGPHLLVAATNGGAADHPLWLRNIVANPNVHLSRDRNDLPMRATLLTADEREQAWPKLVQAYKTYDTMQSKTDRTIAVVRLTAISDN